MLDLKKIKEAIIFYGILSTYVMQMLIQRLDEY